MITNSLPLGRVICGDNCEVMRQWPSQSIDLVVTSPPYDDLRTYGGHSWDFFGVAWNLKRLLKPGGVIVWVVADATKDGSETGTSMEQALHFKRLGLNLHQTMIYEKTGGQIGSQNTYYKRTEYMFVFSCNKPKAINFICDKKTVKQGSTYKGGGGMQKNGIRANTVMFTATDFGKRTNVWKYDPANEVETDHPAPFPSSLACDHIATWSNPGDIILDPFAGSGTTLKAAQNLGSQWVGIEINPSYIEICNKRTAQNSLSLADPEIQEIIPYQSQKKLEFMEQEEEA